MQWWRRSRLVRFHHSIFNLQTRGESIASAHVTASRSFESYRPIEIVFNFERQTATLRRVRSRSRWGRLRRKNVVTSAWSRTSAGESDSWTVRDSTTRALWLFRSDRSMVFCRWTTHWIAMYLLQRYFRLARIPWNCFVKYSPRSNYHRAYRFNKVRPANLRRPARVYQNAF